MSECMGIDKRVQILLSTYNGESYLREQLNSYLQLEGFEQIKVFIRDDGSTDSTCAILREYEHNDSIQVIYGENVGFIRSYQWLINNSDEKCSYFALSDQDDVWLPNKILMACRMLDSYPQEELLLFASRSCLTDKRLKEIGKTCFAYKGISFFNAMVQNVLPGHTQVFNRSLRDSLVKNDYSQAHGIDWWLYLVASSMGKVVYSEECTVYHRQHGENAVGYQLGFLNSLRRRISYIKQGKGNAISLQLQIFLETYRDQLPLDYLVEIKNYLHGLKNLRTRFSYISHCRLYRQRFGENLMFRLLYLIGKYKIN